MTKCSNCGKDIERVYWMRLFPYSNLCHECWSMPDEERATLVRETIAFHIWEMRKINRNNARILYNNIRGTGIPAKVRKKHDIN